jgi:uncharacterized protein YydD (DUF2326 family)
MSDAVITAIIASVTTLLASVGTWYVAVRKYRAENEDLVKKAIADVKDSMTDNIAKIQIHLVEMDMEIKALSERTDKHNKVIERTFKLEQDTAVQTEQIKVINHRIDDLERAQA